MIYAFALYPWCAIQLGWHALTLLTTKENHPA
jgi:hypothetical protein